MQIKIEHECRTCGATRTQIIDSSNLSSIGYEPAELIELDCDRCGRVSGKLGLLYRYVEGEPRQ